MAGRKARSARGCADFGALAEFYHNKNGHSSADNRTTLLERSDETHRPVEHSARTPRAKSLMLPAPGGLDVGSIYSGTVKYYDTAKGFGFIEVELGVDIFFHHSAVVRGRAPLSAMRIGQRVQFLFEWDERKSNYHALEITVDESTTPESPAVTSHPKVRWRGVPEKHFEVQPAAQLQSVDVNSLDDNDMKVLRMLSRGICSQNRLAGALHVNSQVAVAMRKRVLLNLGVETPEDAVAKAQELGFI